MNNKGFTLVELLVMLVVLSILIGVTIPNITGIVSNQKNNALKDDAVRMVDATKNMFAINSDMSKPKSGECVILSLDYIDKSKDIVKGPYGGEYSRYDSFVIYKRDVSTYSYYVRLVEKQDDGNLGIDLTNIEELTSNDSYQIGKINTETSFGESTTYDSIANNDIIKSICPTNTIKRYNSITKETNVSDPNNFSTDSWNTVINALKSGNTSKYNLGDTREIELEGYGKKYIRLVNLTPCTSAQNSKTACGTVLEFTEPVFKAAMINNSEDCSNIGGWKNSTLRKYLNFEFYNSLPPVVQNAIIETKVESGHGYSDHNSENFITRDKIYIYSTKELRGEIDSYDTVVDTKQLDYYRDLGVKRGFNEDKYRKSMPYWLRSASSIAYYNFLYVPTSGSEFFSSSSCTSDMGVLPVFRIA